VKGVGVLDGGLEGALETLGAAVVLLADSDWALAAEADLGTVKAPGVGGLRVDLDNGTLRDVSLVDLSNRTPGDLEREAACWFF
jgi:hypothetical protein